MGKKKGLTVRELLESTYDLLAKRNSHQEIVLPNKILSEIANDSDWHRTRIGYMGYEKVNLFEFNDKNLVIGRGEKCGQYPGDIYDSDILALEINPKKKTKDGKLRKKTDKQLYNDITTAIGKTNYFKNSLIVGMADGMMGGRKSNPLCEKILEALGKPNMSSFIAQHAKYDRELISMSTLRPICKKPELYKPEFANYLAKTIESVLKE